MDNVLRTLYQERASQPLTLGVLVIEATERLETITDTFDACLLIVTNDETKDLFVKHYSYHSKKIALYVVSRAQLKDWIIQGTNKKIFTWLLEGRILFDRNDYLYNLIQDLNDFPFDDRKIRMGLEFSKLIRRYIEGKRLFEQNQYLDAYNYVIHALHHLGRLALIEKGFHPEVTVWEQVKSIEPHIYKMYDELITSEEPLNKRLELLFLASDYFIYGRTKIGSAHILEVLKEKEEWSIQEIVEHPELKFYSIDIFGILEYLVEKEYLFTVLKESKGQEIYHRYYTTKGAVD